MSEGQGAHTCEGKGRTHTISEGEGNEHTRTSEGLLAFHKLEKAENSLLVLLGLEVRRKSSKQGDSLPSLHPVLLDHHVNLPQEEIWAKT